VCVTTMFGQVSCIFKELHCIFLETNQHWVLITQILKSM
jgi:hypothetical protein